MIKLKYNEYFRFHVDLDVQDTYEIVKGTNSIV